MPSASLLMSLPTGSLTASFRLLPSPFPSRFQMSNWPASKPRRVLAALERIGWRVKRQRGSHRLLTWPDYEFAYHGIDLAFVQKVAGHLGAPDSFTRYGEEEGINNGATSTPRLARVPRVFQSLPFARQRQSNRVPCRTIENSIVVGCPIEGRRSLRRVAARSKRTARTAAQTGGAAVKYGISRSMEPGSPSPPGWRRKLELRKRSRHKHR
jgi:hypothetical protein